MDARFGVSHNYSRLRSRKLESGRWRKSFSGQHYKPQSNIWSSGDIGDDHGRELWGDARDEHGEVQRYCGDANKLERDEHRCASADGSNDGQRCGDGWRSGE